MRSFLLRAFALTLPLLALALATTGQTADLSGIVTDASHAVVAGASVVITRDNNGLKREAVSNHQGIYHFSFLLPSSYTVVVRVAGFRVANLSGVKLDPGQEARLDVTLVPATIEESITVRADAASLQSESSALGTEVEPQLVESLPLNGRTFQSLIALAPGVVMPSNLNQSFSQGGIVVNGQRATSNYFTVDGVSANASMGGNPYFIGSSAGGAVPAYTVLGTTHNLVSLDDMQEFKLQTSTYSAALGRAGGGQLQIVTRSGSNDFHGTLYDYFRNEALDAGFPRTPHRQNDFGASLGGPLLKNRTFSLFSYEGLRLRLPFSSISQVPSLSARQAASGAVLQLLNAYPLPNGPENPATMLAALTVNGSDPLSSDNTSIRIDHAVNSKLSLFGRFSEAPSSQSAALLSRRDSSNADFRSVTLGATLMLSATANNDFRLNFSRYRASDSSSLSSFGGAVPPLDSLLFPEPFASSSSSLFVSRGLGLVPLRAGRGADNRQRQAQLVENMAVLKASHQLTFGADYRYLAPRYGPFDYRQLVTFTGVAGALSGVARTVTIQTLDSVTVSFHNLSLYGQDSWKIRPNLTFIYGLRWELEPAPHARGNQELFTLTGFPDLTSLQLAPPGTPVYKTSYRNFAPRLGAAYQLRKRPGRETVIRGGFGTYYDLGIGNIGNAAVSFPHLQQKIAGRVPYPLSSEDASPPVPSLEPPYSGVFNVVPPEHDLPRSYHWNLTVDQRLGAAQGISLSYVGEAGRRLLRQNILFDPNPLFSDSQINMATNASSSDYHAFQVQFQRRMAGGLATLVSYAWSHSSDDTSMDEGFDNLVPPRFDRGPSDFDVRHALSAAFAYDIPAPGRNPVIRAILGNWSADGILIARTALPINVFVERDDIGLDTTVFNARPDRVPGVALYLKDATVPGQRRINADAFSVPIEIRQGNLGRNALRGFSLVQMDFALRRQFGITDRVKLQWRADFFNLFNHPNYGIVDSFLGAYFPPLEPNPTFGIAVQSLAESGDALSLYNAGGPRSIQLSLRLRF
jgi:hypothetical protein